MDSVVQERIREIGVRFKKARKEAGHTQKSIAEVLGVGQAFISYVENSERTPTLETLENFCEKTGVSRLYMYLGEGDILVKTGKNRDKNRDKNGSKRA